MPNPFPKLFVAVDAVISTPNSSEGRAIIIAAFISVGGIVLTQLFNLLYRNIDRGKNKADREANFREKYFYEAYHNRINVYKDVISVLSDMISDDKLTLNTSADDVRRNLDEYVHDLKTLLVRLRLFGSSGSYLIVYSLLVSIGEIRAKDRGVEDILSANTRGRLLRDLFAIDLDKTLNSFSEVVRKETGTHIVEEFIFRYGENDSFSDSDSKRACHQGKKEKKWHPDA
jgi:hypothetical protein